MFKFACGLILGLMLIAVPASAQQVASMEIHVQEGNHVSVYECWPTLSSDTNGSVTVYVNNAVGLVSYSCYLAQQFDMSPQSPTTHNSHA